MSAVDKRESKEIELFKKKYMRLLEYMCLN